MHNRYRSDVPSGENTVVDNDIESLARAGVCVVPYLRSSDEIPDLPTTQRLTLPLRPLHSPWDTRAVARLLQDERPDVLHLHNNNPLISMSVVKVAHAAGVPVVQTVHNQRHSCAKGTFLREGRECTDCLGRRVPWPAVQHACYRDSRPQSLAIAAAMALHYDTYRSIERFLALTPVIAEALVAAGVAANRIIVKPNTVPDPGPVAPPGQGAVFVGRLSEEKGVALLAEAWRGLPLDGSRRLTVVGDGPLRGLVDELATQRADVEIRGRLDAPGVAAAIRSARVLVIPSTCPEAFPMVVLEAMAAGRPIVSTNLGGLPGIVTPDLGWVVAPEAGALRDALADALSLDVTTRARGSRAAYDEKYAPDTVIGQQIEVYRDVVAERVGATTKDVRG